LTRRGASLSTRIHTITILVEFRRSLDGLPIPFEVVGHIVGVGERYGFQPVDQRVRLRGRLSEPGEPTGLLDGDRHERLHEVGQPHR
jgi:hypothetical protein